MFESHLHDWQAVGEKQQLVTAAARQVHPLSSDRRRGRGGR
jgi:hypothetical protein